MSLLKTNYIKKDSIIDSFNPIVKFSWMLLVITIFLISKSMMVFIISFSLTTILAFIGKVGKSFLKGLAFMILPIFLFSLLIHGLFNPIGAGSNAIINFLGINFIEGGLITGLFFGFKISALISIFYLFILTTYPGRIVTSLKSVGLPSKLGFLVNSTLQIVPLMLREAETVIEAQKARGLETKGNLWKRLKAYIPLIGPMIIGSVMHVYERTIALEVRGFNSKTNKTSFYVEKVNNRDKAITIITISLTITYIILKVIGWRL